MALADIKKRIEADAKKEAEEILEKAKKQVEEINKNSEEERIKLQKEYDRKLEREKPEIHERRKIVARLDVRKLKLGAKRKLIEQVFSTALENMQQMETSEYAQFLKSLLKQATEEDRGIVIPGREDKVINADWLKRFNEENGKELELSEERLPIKGGFIFQKGDIDINCTFKMLLDNLHEDLESEIVKSLFSD
ncbi:MAG: V-type ATP synthase subunit E [Thermovirgaceae bacterium]